MTKIIHIPAGKERTLEEETLAINARLLSGMGEILALATELGVDPIRRLADKTLGDVRNIASAELDGEIHSP